MHIPITTPTSLLDMIAYQPDSVVSSVLLRNPGGVITLFAFADGQGLTEHTTAYDATILVLEGAVNVTIGDEEHAVTAGQMLHLPPSVPHALEGDGPFKMVLTLLKGSRAT